MLLGWYSDGKESVMAGETEKITMNLGPIDLGRVDLLVQEGFYSNRTDFIRTAIRNQLAAHADAVSQSIERHTLELGLGISAGRIWRRFGKPERCCISRSSVLPVSQRT